MNKPIPILMYHNVSENKKDKNSLYYKDFYKQIKYLTKIGYKSLNLKNLSEEKYNKKIVVTFDDGYENIYKIAMPILKKFNQQATCFIVKNQIDGFNQWDSKRDDFKKIKLMNVNQIQNWNSNGFEIGSHTLDHLNLTEISYENKNKQINEPIDYFKNKLNIAIESFAYPFGAYDDDCINLLKKNYKYAVTTKPSRYIKNKFSNYEIPRISIGTKVTIFKFLLKILTKYEDFKYKKH